MILVTTGRIVVTVAPLPAAQSGVAYNGQLQSPSGGLAPYRWVSTGVPLPAGLQLDGVTGAITGTPVFTANFVTVLTFTVTDSESPVPVSASYQLTITGTVSTTTSTATTTTVIPTTTVIGTGGKQPPLVNTGYDAIPDAVIALFLLLTGTVIIIGTRRRRSRH